MIIKQTNQKTMWKRAISAVVSMVLILTLIPFQVSAATGSTVYVSTSGELQSALANTSVEKIIFNKDITATTAMKIAANRTSSQLTIDGNGFKFTERYTKLYATSYGIYLTDATTINTITIQNMEIAGQNGYGTIYTIKGINQVFKNVKYNGPQMVYNTSGSVRIEDSEINIGYYNNSYNARLADVNRLVLAGDVKMTKQNQTIGADEMFWLLGTGASITVEDGANVNVTNNHNSQSGSISGFVYSSCAYNFNIGNNAEFTYNGKYLFEETCTLKSFNVGTNSKFDLNLDNGLGWYAIKASDTVNIGDGSQVNIAINGDMSTCYSYVLYAGNDINIGKNAVVDIDTGNVTYGYVMKSLCGNINVGEGAFVDIKTGSLTGGYVVKAYAGSIAINKDASFVVNSYGVMKTNLVWLKRNLTVGEGARLDLIANNNSNVCANYVINIDGCAESYRSTITYNNPERVLFYNDNTSSVSLAYAAKFGCYTSINVNVYDTQYWNSAKKTGGVNVLKDPTYQWYQDPYKHGNYNVTGASTSYCYGFNKSFSTSNYVGNKYGSGVMDATNYYFGTLISCLPANKYEVCLWNGSVPKETTYTVRYLEQGTEKELATADSGTGYVGDSVDAVAKDIDGYDLVGTQEQSIVLGEDGADNKIIFYYTKAEETVTLTYVFNNTIHHRYPVLSPGTPYEREVSESYMYVVDSTDSVKQLDDVFPGYGGTDHACEFLGWSTSKTGTIEYAVGDSIVIDEDITLYGIWRSCQPQVDEIYEGDSIIGGSGVLIGVGATGADIIVKLPNGMELTTRVKTSGLWVVALEEIHQGFILAGNTIEVTQIEGDKEPCIPLIVEVLP